MPGGKPIFTESKVHSHASERPVFVYPVLALGLLSFAFSPILVRLAHEGPGMAIAVWRTTFTVLMLSPLALPRIGAEVRRFTRRDVLLILVSGVLLGFHFVTWIESLYLTSVASASVLVTTSPIFLAALGYIFLKERLSRKEVIAIGVAVVGAGMIGLGDASGLDVANSFLGNGLALLAAFLVSLYMLIGRVVRQKVSWMAYVFPLYVVVALTILISALLSGVPLFSYSAEFYGWCALMALGPQLFGHGSINYALRYLGAALIGLLTLLEPVGASIMAYFLFGEYPHWIALLGMLLVLAAITFAVLPIRRRRIEQRQGDVSKYA